MAFLPQRDQPLPKGLVHGITSIMFESALVPAEPPEPLAEPNADPVHSTSPEHQEEKMSAENRRQVEKPGISGRHPNPLITKIKVQTLPQSRRQ